MYRTITHCRACSSDSLERVVDFGIQPLANDFRRPEDKRAGFYPLDVLWCHNCTLAQLSVVVDPHVLYDRYSYVTSTSVTMKEHFFAIVNDLCVAHGGAPLGDLLEIGSNDGTFLEFAKLYSRSQLGVDPASNLCTIAETRGIRSVNALWGRSSVGKLGGAMFDTIVARHVFAHCDDWVGFIDAIDRVAKRDSVVFIEVPYARHLIDRCEFDTIYHEHLSYVTIRSIHALLKETRFTVAKVIHYHIHGGSIGLVLRTRDWFDNHSSCLSDCETDNITKRDWQSVEHKSRALVGELCDKIDSAEQPLIGFGAPAKAALWIQLAGIDSSKMRVVHDTTPQKHGTLIPGSDIPVMEYSPSLNADVKTAVMWCWNFEAEVRRKEQSFLQRGGRFILPLGNNTGSHKVRT